MISVVVRCAYIIRASANDGVISVFVPIEIIDMSHSR
jgi:hypothetical protein